MIAAFGLLLLNAIEVWLKIAEAPGVGSPDTVKVTVPPVVDTSCTLKLNGMLVVSPCTTAVLCGLGLLSVKANCAGAWPIETVIKVVPVSPARLVAIAWIETEPVEVNVIEASQPPVV